MVPDTGSMVWMCSSSVSAASAPWVAPEEKRLVTRAAPRIELVVGTSL